MKKVIAKCMLFVMLLSSASTGHAAMMLAASKNGDGQQATKSMPCAPGMQAMNKSQLDKQQQAKKSCCDTQGACGQDCSTCVITGSSAAAMVSSFDTLLFIHMATTYHLSPDLYLSSALTNLYKPPRS